MSIIGVDPGWSGGICSLDEMGNLLAVTAFTNTTEADIVAAVEAHVSNPGMHTAYVESVHAMPKQGVSSSFKFGWVYGLLRGILLGRCRIIEVTPQKWQKALGCLSHGDKNVTKAKAQQLFPGLKVTHGNADALLISFYGWKDMILRDQTEYAKREKK